MILLSRIIVVQIKVTSKTNEQAFEALIEKALVGSTVEERKASGQTNPDAQTPAESQYYWGVPSDSDKKVALDQRRLWSFLEATQQEELDKFVGKDSDPLAPYSDPLAPDSLPRHFCLSGVRFLLPP